MKAIFWWHLYIDCPNCGETIDLAEGDYDVDSQFSKHIFNNDWDAVNVDVECEYCAHQININEIEC